MKTLIKNVNIYNLKKDIIQKVNIIIIKERISDILEHEDINYEHKYFDSIIDLDNKFILPAFIDVHSKGDLISLEDFNRFSAVSQGILLEVMGQDAFSVAPVTSKNHILHSRYIRNTLGSINKKWTWESLTSYLDLLNNSIGTNVLYYAPYGTLRLEASLNPVLSKSALSNLLYFLEKSIDEGAIGLSVSTNISPSSLGWVNDEELEPVLKILSKKNKILNVSLQNVEEPYNELEKAFNLAKTYNLKLHVSRLSLSHEPQKLISLIEKKKKDIKDLLIDVSSFYERELSYKDLLPESFNKLSYENIISRIKDEDDFQILTEEFDNKFRLYKDLKILNTSYEKYKEFENCTVQSVADYFNVSVKTIFLDLFENDFLNTTYIYELCSKEVLNNIFKYNFVLPSTDLYIENKILPDYYGGILNYIDKYSNKDIKTIYNKLYKVPSTFFAYNWDINIGSTANFVVLDIENIKCKSSFIDAKATNQGIYSVYSRGKEIFKNNKVILLNKGRVLNWI